MDNVKHGVIFAHFLHVFSSIRRHPIRPECFTYVRNIRLLGRLPETSYLRRWGNRGEGGGAVIAWAGHGLMSREGKRTHLKFPALALPNREGRITPPVIGTGREKDLFTRFSCIRRRGQRCAFRGAARALGGCHITRLARRCRLLPANQRGEELVPGKEGQVRVS